MAYDDYLKAQKLALKAYKKEEIPVGAVIIKDNKIIARAYNKFFRMSGLRERKFWGR